MSNAHFQVIPDGYVGTQVYTLGNTTVGPILDQFGQLRTSGTVPNFTAGVPANIVPMGAYDFVNDDVKYLEVSDDDGGLLIHIANVGVAVTGSVSVVPTGSATYALFTNFGANATLNVLNEPGHVLGVMVQNINAAIRYLQLHNTITTPAPGAVPFFVIPVPATSTVTLGDNWFSTNGMYFGTGIAFAFSTTSGTYTAATASDQMTQILYGAP